MAIGGARHAAGVIQVLMRNNHSPGRNVALQETGERGDQGANRAVRQIDGKHTTRRAIPYRLGEPVARQPPHE